VGSLGSFLAIYHQYPGVNGGPLVQGGSHRAVQSVLQVHHALILHYMREKVTEKR
jgi:hypothetical protein